MADNTAVYETNSLGYKIRLKGPGTVEEYDRAAGKVGACLEDGVYNTIFRGTLPEWQDAFGPKVEELFGQKRQVDTRRTELARNRSKTPDKVADVLETWTTFHNRMLATASDEQKAQLATIAQQVADTITIDPSPSKRAAGVPKEYREKAQQWLTLPEDQLEAKVTKALDAVEGFQLDRDENNKPTEESLARLIQQYVGTLL